jgi:hypothetical protein
MAVSETQHGRQRVARGVEFQYGVSAAVAAVDRLRPRAVARKRVNTPSTTAEPLRSEHAESAREETATLTRRLYDLSLLSALGMIQLVWLSLVAFGVFSFLR